ncbi:MAG: hypothetical protein ABIP49_01340 [Lysobacterales bacterium]
MNADMMLNVAATLLAIGALGGVLMAAIRFSGNRNPPVWLAMVHGLIAAAGLTLLAYATFTAGVPTLAKAALALLLAAALGGAIINLRDHWNRNLISKTWVIGHFVLAAVGLALLLRVTWFG